MWWEPINGSKLDALRYCLRKHISPSLIGLEEPFGGCALRWPVEPSLYSP
jgi:hypothetical protein